MVAVPASGMTSPASIRSVVVLPAPFGPRNPVTSPGAAVKLSPSTTVTWPNRFVTPGDHDPARIITHRPTINLVLFR
jgi:hypothetical protein